MRRRKATTIFKDKIFIAGAVTVLAITATVVGANALTSGKQNEENQNLVDLNELPEGEQTAQGNTEEESRINTSAAENIEADNYDDKTFGLDNVMDATDEYIPEGDTDDNAVLELSKEDQDEAETDEKAAEPAEDTPAKETQSASVTANTADFRPENKMQWPVAGNVLLKYSMDSTIYFATLNQYKYNSALIIQGDVNTKVAAAAAGIVEEIYTDEETGISMKVDLGNGYKATYGQLKETTVETGDMVEKGAVIGYISEPTKYYSVEGSNLYFQVTKDGSPVDPLSFLE